MEIIAIANQKGEVGKTTSYGLKIYENRRDGLMT
jgi:cellulose biosynthesis protein BcsQ